MKKLAGWLFFGVFSVIMLLAILGANQVSAARVEWKPAYSNMLGKPYKHKVIKYSPTGWGDCEGGDRKAYFSSDKHIQYRYIKKSRTVIYRYNNHDKALRSKYNYQKIVLGHGYKTPEYSYYYKLGQQKWAYTVTYRFWLVKPIKY
ncbi:hypothetical protein LASUN_19090 [Lentilactobacillus sunkii]|jgi:hypothetical protein|uniref:Uncharacterized protein n=1 Tax=Lentilactobacillus sunkii TaxID=481719 RepID=A0A1E7XB18_9LACO|nr:hypothetical protein [Lentilactobacillus sunkii]OFA10300.1 hypothetical protein LASUN_19090 [Lentilactobacillus sunkii]